MKTMEMNAPDQTMVNASKTVKLGFIERQIKQIMEGGFPVLNQKICAILSKFFLVIIALPFVVVLRILRPFITVRLLGLDISRIGGMYKADWYLSERYAGRHGKPYFDIFYFRITGNTISNQQWMTMWKRALCIFPYGKLTDMVNKISKMLPGHKTHIIPTSYFLPSARIADKENLKCVLNCRKSHIAFTEEEESRGREELARELGIPEEKSFICFHARDAAFLNTVFPKQAWDYHDYRDSSIHNYIPAVEELVRRGSFAVRMGSIVKERLNTAHSAIIDYACNGKRSDFLDIYLGAKCRFFIGSDVGIVIVPEVFRRPVVYTNWTPLNRISPWVLDGLFICKKFYLHREKRLLSFREMINSPLAEIGTTEKFRDEGIELIESAPEEIMAAAIEMDERLKGAWESTQEDEELQQCFWALLGPHKIKSSGVRIGAEFLRQNRELLK